MAENTAAGNLGDLLLRSGLITEAQLLEANRRRRKEDKTLGRTLVDMGVLNEEKKLALLRQRFGYEIVSLEEFEIDPLVLALLPRSFCERNMVAPILRERNTMVLAMEDPSDVVVLDETRDLAGMEVKAVIASCQDILAALGQYPEKDEEGRVIGAAAQGKSPWFQRLHYVVFFLLSVLPIGVFFLALAGSEGMQDFFVRQLDVFERVLFLVGCWALWAVTLYEVDGLVFGSSHQVRD